MTDLSVRLRRGTTDQVDGIGKNDNLTALAAFDLVTAVPDLGEIRGGVESAAGGQREGAIAGIDADRIVRGRTHLGPAVTDHRIGVIGRRARSATHRDIRPRRDLDRRIQGWAAGVVQAAMTDHRKRIVFCASQNLYRSSGIHANEIVCVTEITGISDASVSDHRETAGSGCCVGTSDPDEGISVDVNKTSHLSVCARSATADLGDCIVPVAGVHGDRSPGRSDSDIAVHIPASPVASHPDLGVGRIPITAIEGNVTSSSDRHITHVISGRIPLAARSNLHIRARCRAGIHVDGTGNIDGCVTESDQASTCVASISNEHEGVRCRGRVPTGHRQSTA